MGYVILVVLAVLWAAVLVPPLMRARSEHVSRDSIRDFSFKIGALGHANAPYRPAAFRSSRPRPAARGPVATSAASQGFASGPAGLPAGSDASERSSHRRRQVWASLGLANVVTFMLATSGMRGAWISFGLVVALSALYGVAVVWFRQGSLEPLAPVRYLPTIQAPQPVTQLAYRRTVNS